ncbi:ERF family protein [Lactobacillus kitasatonis]|uniref:ERF family protein n=1 Tax=Lactobacillus kitasatonis TaxID=237446 RepID=UPI0026EAD2F7|nr:ERF family protein [Lactobacillus kitasatonis]
MVQLIEGPADLIGQAYFKAISGLSPEAALKAKLALLSSFINVQHKLLQPTKDKQGYGYKYADLNGVIKAIQDASADEDIAYIQQPVTNGGKTGVHNYLINSQGAIFDFGAYLLDISSPNPQDYGKAQTYARRYSISAIYGIASEDDTDAKEFKSKPDYMTPKELKGMTINYDGKRRDLTEVFAMAMAGDELAKQVIKGKGNSVNTKIAIKSISAIYDFSKKLMDDRNKEQAKQDAEDKKIKELVDGKKDPFKKLGEKDA